MNVFARFDEINSRTLQDTCIKEICTYKSHIELQREKNLIELAPSPYSFIMDMCVIYMNVFARFDANPFMRLQDIKEIKLHIQKTLRITKGNNSNSIGP